MIPYGKKNKNYSVVLLVVLTIKYYSKRVKISSNQLN